MQIRVLLCFAMGALACPAIVSAQTFESVGVRARGLGGAFVAVADDATASWWNPAGLASGAYLSAVIERGQLTESSDPVAAAPARRTKTTTVAVAFPALGLSYYRFRIAEASGPATTAAGNANRQDPLVAGTGVRALAVSQYGATAGQSIGDHVVVGSTLKLLRAGAESSVSSGASPLDDADGLDLSARTKFDLDLGVMARVGYARLAVAVKNVTEPRFEDGNGLPFTLRRQVRAGVALSQAPNALQTGLTVAGDVDLTTTSTVLGDVRHVAAGIEGWIGRGRVGLRAGASANTIGARRPSGSAGISVRLTRAFHVNASATVGRDDSVTGWSSSVSATF